MFPSKPIDLTNLKINGVPIKGKTSLSVVPFPKTHECPKCCRVLAVAEVIERYCAHCGDIDPREVRI